MLILDFQERSQAGSIDKKVVARESDQTYYILTKLHQNVQKEVGSCMTRKRHKSRTTEHRSL